MLSDLAQSLLDLLFPPRCVACGSAGSMFCAACQARMRAPEPPLCDHCGRTLVSGDQQACPACRSGHGPTALTSLHAAAVHEGPIRDAVFALKYRGQRRLAASLGEVLAATVTRLNLRPDVIVPVPLHVSRRRQRGYNQAELLAQRCARRLRIAYEPALLGRVRDTPPQVGLASAARRANVADAFAAPARAASRFAGKRVLLLDDVTTTGSTLDAAAAALLPFAPAALLGLALTRPASDDDSRDTRDAPATARKRHGRRS